MQYEPWAGLIALAIFALILLIISTARARLGGSWRLIWPEAAARRRSSRIAAILGLGLVLSACATAGQLGDKVVSGLPIKTPAQGVFAMRGGLVILVGLADSYEGLAPCQPGGSAACANPAIVAKMNAAAPAAAAVMNSAVAAVSDPASSSAAKLAAIGQAASALAAFQAPCASGLGCASVIGNRASTLSTSTEGYVILALQLLPQAIAAGGQVAADASALQAELGELARDGRDPTPTEWSDQGQELDAAIARLAAHG